MEKVDVLIIGAGLCGLTAARRLNKEYLLLEAESQPGGKARSITSGGSTYDFTGHLLHLRTREIGNLVDALLPDAFNRIVRRNGIFMREAFMPYPFQANFHALPHAEVRECLLGYLNAWKQEKQVQETDSLARWALATFGRGICEHFFYPYNEKLYCTPCEQMSADWVAWSVPRPPVESVVDGALGREQGSGLGYNASFLYPKQGGIDILPRALAADLADVHYQSRVVALDADNRVAVTEQGNEIHYQQLISTMPLPSLLAMVEGNAPVARFWRKGLRWVNVYNLNYTLSRPPSWDWQWLYLPEPAFVCYRIGVSSNISPALAPEGQATVYTEISYLPDENSDEEAWREMVRRDLERLGLLRSGVDILDETAVDLPCAYVVHDHFRMMHLPDIHAWLRRRNIISTGRWGAWTYGGMEDAMLQGVAAAQCCNQE